jgi:phage shock protein PspC (stress-responsive transcriptional regulator)/predicted membrane protein
MRSRQHRVIAGVCGGIAAYFQLDPVLVRVGFVLLALFTRGLGLIAYVVLWVVMPEDASESGPQATNGSSGVGGGGALVLGVLLMAAGAVWLLEAVAAISVDWGLVASIALIVIGALVMVTARHATRALVTLGVVLTLALAGMAAPGMHRGDMRFDSAFGDHMERPRAASALAPSYNHAFGSMTLDLRSIELPPGTTQVSASNSFGSTQVLVPPDVPVRVVASTAFGSISMFGEELGGFGERTVQTDGYDTAQRRLEITVSTAFGSAEVRR